MRSSISRKNILLLILAGLILGIISIISPGTLFVILLSFLAWFFIARYSPSDDRGFLLRLFVWGMVAHFFILFFSRVFSVFLKNGVFFGDEYDNLYRGDLLIKYALSNTFVDGRKIVIWNGITYDMPNYFKFGLYNQHFYTYFLSFWMFLFGPSIFAIKLLNSFCGVITAVFGYILAKDWFNKTTAKISGIVICFYPTLLLWSVTLLKDTFFIMFAFLSLFFFSFLVKTKKIKYLSGLLFVLYMMYLLREKMSFLGLVSLFLFFFAFSFLPRGKPALKSVVLAICFILFLFFLHFKGSSLTEYLKYQTFRFYHFHYSVFTSGGVTYKIMGDQFYVRPAVYSEWTLPVQLQYIFFAVLQFFTLPHFWSIRYFSQLLFFPFTVFWWVVLIFFLIGVRFSIKRKDAAINYSLLITLFFALLLSVTGGNIGTIIRHRDMITPIILAFSSYGLVRFFGLSKEN